MPYPRRLLSSDESILREFRPHWRMLFIPAFWTVLGLVLLVPIWSTTDGTAGWVLTALTFGLWLYLGLWGFVKWWFTHYVLTNERLITRSGVFTRSGIEIPLESINDIRFSQNLLERMLKSGDLVIESAGEMGQSRFSDIPHPEDFQSLVYTVREERKAELQGGGAELDATRKLERLARLHKEGALTDEEFEAKKQDLLEDI